MRRGDVRGELATPVGVMRIDVVKVKAPIRYTIAVLRASGGLIIENVWSGSLGCHTLGCRALGRRLGLRGRSRCFDNLGCRALGQSHGLRGRSRWSDNLAITAVVIVLVVCL